jgi:TRAP-type uncharacterized transport system fused permease subunit
MGVPAIAAHMFVFYFGIVADITPPVALASYAGAAIAKSNPMKTGINSTRLAIAAFIVPYIFVLNPAMLFIETTPRQVIQILITSIAGMYALSAALEGYMFRVLKWWQRIPAAAAGLLLIDPSAVTDLIGVLVFAFLVVSQHIQNKNSQTDKV